jgi:N-acetylmuramoyl-L-alanine amidase
MVPITIVLDDLTGEPVAGALIRFADGTLAEGDPAGQIMTFPSDTAGAVVFAPGYEPAPAGSGNAGPSSRVPVTRMTPLYGGALHGRKIVIDPAGGGTDDAGRGTAALRGATVNMRLARELEQLLSEGGARVVLTRKGEEILSDQNRVFRTNRAGADLAIGLRFGATEGPGAGCTVYHYPGSVTGTAVADSLAAGLQGIPPCESFGAAESSDLFLQQTNCPAVVISGGALSDDETENILGSPRWTAIEAEAIMRSLVAFFGG